MPPLPYQPALTGLRGLCVLLVLAHHGLLWPGWSLPGGWLGVDGFFVLSGYLITALLCRERAATGRIALGAFYRRRAARLLPALWLVCGAVALLGLAGSVGGWSLLTALTYTTDLGLLWTQDIGAFGPLGGTWTLAIEEHFYLLWPLLIRRAPRCLLRGCLLAWGGVAGGRVLAVLLGVGEPRLFANPVLRLDGILVGAALALALHRGAIRPTPALARRIRRALLWCLPPALAALVLAPGAAVLPGPLLIWPLGGYGLAAGAWGLLLLYLVVAPDGRLARVLSYRPLLTLGTISYGVYLWQGVFLALGVGPLVALAATLAVAALSYRYIELPIRRCAHPRPPSRSLARGAAQWEPDKTLRTLPDSAAPLAGRHPTFPGRLD